MRIFLWWWRTDDHDRLERAKEADERADEHLAEARRNSRRATQLLIKNSLSERFIKEIRENHA